MTINSTDFIGVLLPPVIQLMVYEEADEKKRFLATILICLFASVFLNFNKITLNSWQELLTTFTLIFSESQIVYKLYFKESAFKNFIDRRLTPNETKVEPAG